MNTTTSPPSLDLDLTTDEQAWLGGLVERPCQVFHRFGDIVLDCDRPAVAIAVYAACPTCGQPRRSRLICDTVRQYGVATCGDDCYAQLAVTWIERLR